MYTAQTISDHPYHEWRTDSISTSPMGRPRTHSLLGGGGGEELRRGKSRPRTHSGAYLAALWPVSKARLAKVAAMGFVPRDAEAAAARAGARGPAAPGSPAEAVPRRVELVPLRVA